MMFAQAFISREPTTTHSGGPAGKVRKTFSERHDQPKHQENREE
jgi:hypothetical protein